jgi:hypothetical protein
MYARYYASMLRCWQLIRILVKTNHPCLRVGRHSWYQPYEYNTSLTVIFLKRYDDDMLRCPYKDYSSLNRWQANMDLFSVTTHR